MSRGQGLENIKEGNLITKLDDSFECKFGSINKNMQTSAVFRRQKSTP